MGILFPMGLYKIWEKKGNDLSILSLDIDSRKRHWQKDACHLGFTAAFLSEIIPEGLEKPKEVAIAFLNS